MVLACEVYGDDSHSESNPRRLRVADGDGTESLGGHVGVLSARRGTLRPPIEACRSRITQGAK